MRRVTFSLGIAITLGWLITSFLLLKGLALPAFAQVECDDILICDKTDSPDPVSPGGLLTYTLEFNHPDAIGADVEWTDLIPLQTTFSSLTVNSLTEWTCTTPAPGGTGTASCGTMNYLGDQSFFDLSVLVDPTATGTIANTVTFTEQLGQDAIVAFDFEITRVAQQQEVPESSPLSLMAFALAMIVFYCLRVQGAVAVARQGG